MSKLIRIEFELIGKQQVIIFGYDEKLNKKEIGRIFTPSGSSEDIINAIQVCGFSEAFDFWGCANYEMPLTTDDRSKIIYGLKEEKIPLKQTKDIQLLFDFEANPTRMWGRGKSLDECEGCFNNPCTCDNKGNHKHISPYNIKRQGDLPILENKGEYGEFKFEEGILMDKNSKSLFEDGA